MFLRVVGRYEYGLGVGIELVSVGHEFRFVHSPKRRLVVHSDSPGTGGY